MCFFGVLSKKCTLHSNWAKSHKNHVSFLILFELKCICRNKIKVKRRRGQKWESECLRNVENTLQENPTNALTCCTWPNIRILTLLTLNNLVDRGYLCNRMLIIQILKDTFLVYKNFDVLHNKLPAFITPLSN